MAKVKNIGLIIMLIALGACTQVDQFWENYDNIPEFTPGCITAQNGVSAAANAFNNSTEANYEQNCALYAEALQLVIDSCGDPSGSFQSTLESLGGCEYTGGGSATDCSSAEIAVSTAQQVFAQYSPGQDGYQNACTLYKNALLSKIEYCGDPAGSIMATVNGLNCESNTPASGSINFSTANGNLTFSNNITVNISDGDVVIHAENDTGNWSVDVELPENSSGVDIVNVFTLMTATSTFNIWEEPTSSYTPWESNITVNNGSSVQGTFLGSIISTTGGINELSNGTININY